MGIVVMFWIYVVGDLVVVFLILWKRLFFINFVFFVFFWFCMWRYVRFDRVIGWIIWLY